jgi:hypothetical protein
MGRKIKRKCLFVCVGGGLCTGVALHTTACGCFFRGDVYMIQVQ